MTAHFVPGTASVHEAATPQISRDSQVSVNPVSLMTSRQLEIMLMLAEGKVNKQIAYDLDLSPATVKVHIRNAITRLGAKNLTNAVAIVAVSSALFKNSLAFSV